MRWPFFSGRKLASLLLTLSIPWTLRAESPWAVYYSNQLPLETFKPYGLLVLDSQYHPPLEPLKAQGKKLLGYISLGEVEKHRHFYPEVKAEGILLMENQYWKGSYFVDVRDARWTRRVIEELIPALLQRGFDGIFIDTMDNPSHLERIRPKAYQGMTAAAVNLLRTIRVHFPKIPIMLNRGYDLYDQGGAYVDMLLGESLYADYNFEQKTYQLVEPELYQQQLAIFQKVKSKYPKLELFSLDYWDPEDVAGIQKIYAEERKNGFRPFVSTIKLDIVVPEPQ
ncbi:MAG: endo alpha-1,4 polygalactosaminidase [bacterium]|nr:endo alpha-1,4 polygalactosaminidase [bacterium]